MLVLSDSQVLYPSRIILLFNIQMEMLRQPRRKTVGSLISPRRLSVVLVEVRLPWATWHCSLLPIPLALRAHCWSPSSAALNPFSHQLVFHNCGLASLGYWLERARGHSTGQGIASYETLATVAPTCLGHLHRWEFPTSQLYLLSLL